jgi:cysteine desulfurase
MAAYLDYQSSKPVDPRVVDAMVPFMTTSFGNPSSLHTKGQKARQALEESREAIANFMNADAGDIIFTSGATESINLALIGFALRNKDKGNHIITTETEHISIHNIAKYLAKAGFTVTKIPVDEYGKVSVDALAAGVTEETILVSAGYASNEIGTVQDIAGIGEVCREKGIAFHSDAVAAEGLLPVDVERLNLDLVSLSSNDIYGPKGLGVLYRKKGVKLIPQLIGGGQELGLRSGTENIAGIVGMAEAARIMHTEMPGEVDRIKGYRDQMIEAVLERIPRSYLNGHPTERLANNAHFRFDGVEGEALLLTLNARGVMGSTGSACSSKTLEPSHTLLSLGLSHEQAHGSLELTCGRFTKQEDVDTVLEVLPGILAKLRELSPLYDGD